MLFRCLIWGKTDFLITASRVGNDPRKVRWKRQHENTTCRVFLFFISVRLMSAHDEPNSSKHICHIISVYPTNSSKQTSTAERSNNECFAAAKGARRFYGCDSLFLLTSLLFSSTTLLLILIHVPLINPPDSLGERGGRAGLRSGGWGRSGASCHLHSPPAGQSHESASPNCSKTSRFTEMTRRRS